MSHEGRLRDGRTGRCRDMMKAIVAISNYANSPKEQLGLVLDEYKYIVALIIETVV
jgi:hypothetical protein